MAYGDNISRQAAIDALTEYGNGRAIFISVGEAVIRMEQLPPARPEPHWIPCSERLPKQRESVIISVNAKYGNWVGEGCYWETTENHVIWKGYRWNATYWDDEIIAWMPLPEPYRGKEK